jgi:hypothetical protein
VNGRVASIFACFTDTVVTPEAPLAPVDRTDAAEFFGIWLSFASKANAAGLRAAVIALELGPVALGYRRRMRQLDRATRGRYLQQLEKHKTPQIRQLTKALKGIAYLCYYGDDGVMKTLGYDADANVARGRALRTAEGRP